ncbi:nonsense-mediated mRNA decay factor SMG7-like [Malania oleifera]|uniref:nonsense-mediated mRNA decay factor SMG7-like n=1 Tax=Malania oleifera TaxID=397392 RepID=UPI0025AE41E8|nr:nonsense-mediated mRNA decay factor SMG7-like [Malania oleifera]
MTILMDNSLDLSSRERAQRLYNKNVELESRRRRSVHARIPSDPNAWQQMRENYEAIILEDHAFSEQHEIEYALWQLHYKRIEELRAHFTTALASTGPNASQSGKSSSSTRLDRITKIRSQFKAFLSEATGFYHDLMLKIRAKYGLPLGYFSDDSENQMVMAKDGNKSAETKKGLISCHRCLIYLGDLARYKGLYGEGDSKVRDFAAASSYYMQASSLWPSSGNPHHQLAILASYSGDELLAIYRYFRSLAVESPFSTARDNLIIAFEKNRQSYSQLHSEVKSSPVKSAPIRMTGKARGKVGAKLPFKENKTEASSIEERSSSTSETFKAFSIRFVRLNGILFTRTSLETFGEVFSMVRDDLLELLSSGPEEEYNFSSSATESGLLIVRLIAILIFTIHNVNRETENQSYAEILQRSVLLQNAFTAIFEFMGHIIERCIQLHDPSVSYLLPGVLVFVEWLACHPDIAAGKEVEEKQASARSFFWNHCVNYLNKLLLSGLMFTNEDEDESCFFNTSTYEVETANRLALMEDFELRGFLPLLPAQLILDFSRKHSLGSDGTIKEQKARIQRIIAAGKALVNVVQVGQQGIYFDRKMMKFSIGADPEISNDVVLTSPLEVPAINGMGQKHPTEKKVNLGVLLPKGQQLHVEGEDEDEVIVFKPSMTEKQADMNASGGEFGSYVGSLSELHDGKQVRNAFDLNSRPPTSVNVVSHQLQPIQPSIGTSKWLVEQAASVATSSNNLSFVENGLPMKPESDGLGVLDPAPFLFPHSFSPSAGTVYSSQVPETVIPSKFDSIMFSGPSFDTLPAVSSSTMLASARKNPVSRPVRHFGPPPGFSPVPPQQIDESSPALSKSENPLLDDYSWLDGYQLPSSIEATGFKNHNQPAKTYHHANSNSLAGTLCFPFPGKQVPTTQVHVENQKWQDYQFLNHQKLHQEQQLQLQQQLQKGSQPFTPLLEHQGQPLWEGRFFV